MPIFNPSHYWIQALCRVPNALGKGYFALGKAFAECSTRQRASGKKSVGKEFFAECLLSGTRQSLLPSAQHSAKLEPKKTRKNGNFFLIGGGPHRPAPAHLRHFSRKFRSNAADGIRTRDLPLRANLLYHCTTLSLVSRFRFSSQHIILNRV